MKRSWLLLRSATLALAFVHVFPAQKHVALFFAAPSLAEAWKGFGALIAVVLYLLPPRTQARLLCVAWSRARPCLVALGWLLAAAHLAPALDHFPRLLAEPCWPDAWRGLGASFAAAWFVLPIEHQARILGWLSRRSSRETSDNNAGNVARSWRGSSQRSFFASRAAAARATPS